MKKKNKAQARKTITGSVYTLVNNQFTQLPIKKVTYIGDEMAICVVVYKGDERIIHIPYKCKEGAEIAPLLKHCKHRTNFKTPIRNKFLADAGLRGAITTRIEK